jgi:hypothetical protein
VEKDEGGKGHTHRNGGGGYWLLGVIGLLAWISPVEWVSLSVFHIFNLNRKRLSVLLVRVD